MNHPIGLLTDFGGQDHYVGSLKGVILSIHPKAIIFDITHEIPPQNITAASFVLDAVFSTTPRGAVLFAVVDPGVGSERRPIALQCAGRFLIGPDNGIFARVLKQHPLEEARLIQNHRFFRKPVSQTFHGRDIFAPVAAHLSRANIFAKLGPKIHSVCDPALPVVRKTKTGVTGCVIYVDRFGNALTDIPKDLCGGNLSSRDKILVSTSRQAARLRSFFSEGNPGELIAVWNSGSCLELAVRNSSAACEYGIKIGDRVDMVTTEWRKKRPSVKRK